ncbi:MAG: hypothetical protein HOJ49_01850 [Nitrospina sp.]|nr:hypothetical protein [Nitrospina sp.]
MSFLKILTSLTLLFLLPGVFSPFRVSAEVFDKVAAKVNNEIITLSSVEERAEVLRQKYAGAPVSVSGHDLLQEAIDMLVEEKLQVQQGKKYGFVIDEDAVTAAVDEIKNGNNLTDEQLSAMLEREGRSLESYKAHIRDQIMVTKIARFEIGNRVKISDKSVFKYYKENQKEFWEEGQVRARHILFIVERGSPNKIRQEKLQLAKKVLAQIRRGADFAEMAMKHSEDISASSGGDVGFVTKGKMVREFEDAVFSLKPGKVSDIVETEYGFHIVKVEEVVAGKTLPLKDVKDRVHQILMMKKQKQVYGDWIAEMKEAAFIEISLFEGSNKALVSNKRRADNDRRPKTTPDKKKLQKKWIEMYESVEKSKSNSSVDNSSKQKSLEQQLKRIKRLRRQNKISEQQYQKRKEQILNRL